MKEIQSPLALNELLGGVSGTRLPYKDRIAPLFLSLTCVTLP